MKSQTLNGTWKLTQLQGNTAFDTAVPGDVMTALYQAKVINDPFYRENERDVLWVGEADWGYERTFKVSRAMLQQDRVLLKCDGLDTFATIWINHQQIAKTHNMHCRFEWDIKSLLTEGENTIRINFESVNGYTRQKQAERPIRSNPGGCTPHAKPAWVRKQACNFGWDWGPQLVTAGIWRDIKLVAYSTARIADLHIRQTHSKNQVKLDIKAQFDRENKDSLSTRFMLKFKGRKVAEATTDTKTRNAQIELDIDDPKLWWPNGMGDQPLYDLEVEITDCQNNVLDTMTKRIGLRTLELDCHDDQWGESFQFLCNGVPFFCKGANWIPADALISRRTDADYRRLIEDAAAVNMNMLRVWGGGIYEDDVFYDVCDELGICVWQDFMFACMAYPSWDRDFMKSVEQEARDNVRRLRHHASLALWCGNNEIEQQCVEATSEPGIGEVYTWAKYGKLFDKLLPKVVKEEDPDTDYWPSSPHSPQGDRLDDANPKYGDAHLWGVWHGKKPFEWFRECEHRFNSEFGFQSFPEPKTVYGYTEPDDRNVTTPVMEHHQRSGIGNTTIMQYMLDWFRLPTSFDMTLWLSQILQGMAIKYACEHWRRSMPRGMGTLYWQLNDVWPVASWASIDYHGRWKALHYMARHFFANVLVSGLEDREQGTVEIHITSDRLESKAGKLSWIVTDAKGKKLLGGKKVVKTPINANQKVETLKLAALRKQYTDRDLLVWIELTVQGEPDSSNLVTFARPKQLELDHKPDIKPTIQARKDGSYNVALKTQSPALWTWLELQGIDAIYSDNFVHLRPGSTTTINVKPNRELKAADFRKKLQVRSLIDTWK